MTRRRTLFDQDVEVWSSDEHFREEYGRARAEIDGVDQLIRALDGRRASLGLSKADVARAMQAEPSVVRRLFTAADSNPTVTTLIELTDALGLRVVLEKQAGSPRAAVGVFKETQKER